MGWSFSRFRACDDVFLHALSVDYSYGVETYCSSTYMLHVHSQDGWNRSSGSSSLIFHTLTAVGTSVIVPETPNPKP